MFITIFNSLLSKGTIYLVNSLFIYTYKMFILCNLINSAWPVWPIFTTPCMEEWHRPVKKYLDVTSTSQTNWTNKWLPFVTSVEPCTSGHSDQTLYNWLTSLTVLILISLKMIIDSSKMEGGLFHLRFSAG